MSKAHAEGIMSTQQVEALQHYIDATKAKVAAKH